MKKILLLATIATIAGLIYKNHQQQPRQIKNIYEQFEKDYEDIFYGC